MGSKQEQSLTLEPPRELRFKGTRPTDAVTITYDALVTSRSLQRGSRCRFEAHQPYHETSMLQSEDDEPQEVLGPAKYWDTRSTPNRNNIRYQQYYCIDNYRPRSRHSQYGDP